MGRNHGSNLEVSLESAIAQVRTSFPFPGYLDADFDEAAGALVKAVVQHAAPPARLLDIGSGPMDVTAVFAGIGYECHAVDDLMDPWHLLENNRAKIADFAHRSGIEFHRHSAPEYDIPYDAESFDVVVSRAVIEHLHESPRELLNSAFSYTKAGGIVVIAMPNALHLKRRMDALLGRSGYPSVKLFYHSPSPWRGHVREYTLSETEYILRESGGEILYADTYHSHLRSRLENPFVRVLFRALTSSIPTLRTGLLVIARKPADWKPSEFDAAAYWSSTAGAVPDGVRGEGAAASGRGQRGSRGPGLAAGITEVDSLWRTLFGEVAHRNLGGPKL